MTQRYRANKELILDSGFRNKNILSLSETFNRAEIEELLSKPGCTAIRIYYGMDEDKKVHAILVASDANNADILGPTNSATTEDEEDDWIVETGIRCPVVCPEDSPLNEDNP